MDGLMTYPMMLKDLSRAGSVFGAHVSAKKTLSGQDRDIHPSHLLRQLPSHNQGQSDRYLATH
jgi:hypothetical protein